jgi:hypothetical protein
LDSFYANQRYAGSASKPLRQFRAQRFPLTYPRNMFVKDSTLKRVLSYHD